MPYTGETKLKICSRGNQHGKNLTQNEIDYSGIVQHSLKCDKGIEWESLTTLKVEKPIDLKEKYGRHLKFSTINVDRKKVE